MTYRELVAEAAEKLKSGSIPFCDTPQLDSSVLLAYAANMSRETLFASYPDTVPGPVQNKFSELINSRLSGLPVSYIRKLKEFYGREFYVDESVLVPRPDTEIIIEKTLSLAENRKKTPAAPEILDLCTGSGCIAVTLKLEQQKYSVTAADISEAALKTAVRNAEKLGAYISFSRSDLFSDIKGTYDFIVTNPPYLTSEEIDSMTASGWPEPMLALDGGSDGLDLIRIIINSSLDYLKNNGYLLIEAGPDQAETVSRLLDEAGFSEIVITKDLAGRNRVTSGRKRGTQDKEI